MFQQFLKSLNEPFPEPPGLYQNSINIAGVGVFITLFLYLIRPFGLDFYQGSTFLFCLGFGVVTILVGILFEFFSHYVLKIRKDLPSWTLKHWILNILILLLLIAVGNYCYINILSNWTHSNWTNFATMVYSTFLIGIFPTIFAGLNIQLRAAKANQVNAERIQSQLKTTILATQPLQLFAQNQKQSLELNLEQLYFIESMQNYVAIHYQEGDRFKKMMLRNTIANLQEQVEKTTIIRCHRSYLVNTKLITQVQGNAQGLKLQLKGMESTQVPVSRKYIPTLREHLS